MRGVEQERFSSDAAAGGQSVSKTPAETSTQVQAEYGG